MRNKFLVSSSSDLSKSQGYVLRLLDNFAHKNGFGVYFDIEANWTRERPSNDGFAHGFVVYYFAVPECSSNNGVRLSKLYDFDHTECPLGNSLFINDLQTIDGKVIYDTNGYQMAVIEDKTLFLLIRLFRSNDQKEILSKILDDCQRYFDDPVEFDRVMSERQSLGEVNMMCEVLNREIEVDFEKSLEAINQELIRLRSQVFMLSRERLGIRKEETRKSQNVSWEDAERMLKNLCSYSATGKVSFEDSYLVVPIGQIDIEHEGVVYDIGELVIRIDVNDGEISCRNMTRRIRCEYAHPHVGPSGDICLGSADYGVEVLIGNMQYDVAVLMIIQFLKTYNEENPYCYVTEWPEKNTD